MEVGIGLPRIHIIKRAKGEVREIHEYESIKTITVQKRPIDHA